jgi:hypothetical protein
MNHYWRVSIAQLTAMAVAKHTATSGIPNLAKARVV